MGHVNAHADKGASKILVVDIQALGAPKPLVSFFITL